MVKFCLKTHYGIPYAYYDCMCNECNWMGELEKLVSGTWDDFNLCPKCGTDDIEVFDDPVYCKYIIMPTEWGKSKGVDNGI